MDLSREKNFEQDLSQWDPLEHLENLRGLKVLVLGDVGLDEYVQGTVERISPEAPVPVVHVRESMDRLGLSTNVAANIQALGGEPLLISLVGEDSKAQTLRDLLKKRGISGDHLISYGGRPTISKLRIMSGPHHIVRVDREEPGPLPPELLNPVQERLVQLLPQCQGVIIQDYGKGFINQNSCPLFIKLAHGHNKKVVIDPHPRTPLLAYKGAHFMTPNREEAHGLFQQIHPGVGEVGVDLVGRGLMESIESSQMVVTLGAQGMKLFQGEKTKELPTLAREVFDVTGAGDTVVATLGLATFGGWSLEQAGCLANLAAGSVVGRVGAVACSEAELREHRDRLSLGHL